MKTLPPDLWSAELEAICGSLPVRFIEDYLRGVGGPATPPHIPGDALCFVRWERSSVLGGEPTRSHHGRHVLIVSARGAGRVCVDEDLHLLKPGEALLIPPYAFHTYTDMEADLCWAFLTFDAPAEVYATLAAGGARALGVLEGRLVVETVRCWSDPRLHSQMLLHLGLLLARLRDGAGPQRAGQGLPGAQGGLLRAINRYLIPRLSESIGVGEVARAVGQSESHLRARFREIAGVSLGRHLRELRLQRACLLLNTTSLPVGEIATQCGFSSLYAFSRTFRQWSGKTPSRYRKHGVDLAHSHPVISAGRDECAS